MRLDLLLERIEVVSVRGDTSRVVLRVSEDSRDVDWQTAFVAVEGSVVDGHRFASGLDCAVVIAERPVEPAEGVPLVLVKDSRAALAKWLRILKGALLRVSLWWASQVPTVKLLPLGFWSLSSVLPAGASV